MWTGFRLALGGAQERFGVTADLACFSKAVANGMPLSVLTGRADVMSLLERDVFFFSTFGGEALSLAAAAATLRELRRRDVPAQLDELGTRLRDGLNALCERLAMGYVRCSGYGCRTLVSFTPPPPAAAPGTTVITTPATRAAPGGADPLIMKSFVQQELVRRGILWNGFHNLCAAHTAEDVAYLLGAYGEILPRLQAELGAGTLGEALRGQPVEPVFRRTTQFNLKPKRGQSRKGVSDVRA